MTRPILSILIPTITERKDLCKQLVGIVMNQAIALEGVSPEGSFDMPLRFVCINVGAYEIISLEDNKEMTIGEKRELLYKRATGHYSWMLDDDDSISENALYLIFNAITKMPDCITFHEHCTIDGGFFSSRHSLEYEDWEGTGDHILPDGFHFHRTPFFKDVIRTEIAQSIPIPHIRWGEDHQWAQALKPHLKSEIHIPEYLYYYQHTSTNHNERYGIK